MDLQAFVSQVGFPAAMAVYLLWRLDKRLEQLTDVLAAQKERACTHYELCSQNHQTVLRLLEAHLKPNAEAYRQ